MSWEEILNRFQQEALRKEMDILSDIPNTEDPDELYKYYLEIHNDNATMISLFAKIKDMDNKLDKILEKLN